MSEFGERLIRSLSELNETIASPDCTLASINGGLSWIPLESSDALTAARDVVTRLVMPEKRKHDVLVQKDGKTFRCSVTIECRASVEE